MIRFKDEHTAVNIMHVYYFYFLISIPSPPLLSLRWCLVFAVINSNIWYNIFCLKYPPPKSLMLWWHVVMKIEYKMKHHIWKKDSWKNPAILFIGGRGWENFFPSQILPLPTGRYIMFSDMTSFVIQNFMTSSVICLKVLVLCSAWIEDELCSVCWSIALLMQFLCSVLNQISV